MDSVADRSLRGSAVASGGIVFISYPPLERSKVHLGVVASESAVEQRAEPDEMRDLVGPPVGWHHLNALRKLAPAFGQEKDEMDFLNSSDYYLIRACR